MQNILAELERLKLELKKYSTKLDIYFKYIPQFELKPQTLKLLIT